MNIFKKMLVIFLHFLDILSRRDVRVKSHIAADDSLLEKQSDRNMPNMEQRRQPK